MEKPKRKEGMLAAGKKRLEQFREKKQGKGSASKHAKPETDLEHGRPDSNAGSAPSKGNKSKDRIHHTLSDDLQERDSSKSIKAKGSTHYSSSDDLEAANTISDRDSNEISVNLKVVRADDANPQIDVENISANVLDHGSAHADENALEQYGETGQKKLVIGNNELCLRIDSLEHPGLDVRGSPFATDYLKAPVESELSINMLDLVAQSINVKRGLVNHDDGTSELSDEGIVMNPSCSDYSESVQAGDKEQKSMSSVEFSEAEMPLKDQPLAEGVSTELGDEKVFELHGHAKHSEEAGLEHDASSQDLICLQSTPSRDDEDVSRQGHDLDSGSAEILPSFDTTSASLECIGITTCAENMEHNLSSSCDAETGINHLMESKINVNFDTDVADRAHLVVPGTEVCLSPISEAPIVADAIDLHCTGKVLSLGSDDNFNMEQPRTGELDDTYSGSNLIGMPADSYLNQVGHCLNDNCILKAATDDSYQDGMPAVSRKDMTRIDGGEVTVLNASEPAGEIVALSGELTDGSCSVGEDVILVSPKIDGMGGEISLVHNPDEGLNSNVVLDQNPGTDLESGSISSGSHEIIEAGVNSRDTGINTEIKTTVKPAQEAMESVHIESLVNPIQESFPGDDLNCSSSVEVELATSGEDQMLKTTASSTDGGVGSAEIVEVEEIATSDTCHYTMHEANLPDNGANDITMDTASAKIEVPFYKNEDVQGTMEEVINEGPDRSIGLTMNTVVEDCGSDQNLKVGDRAPLIQLGPSSGLKTESLKHEEIAALELPCCDEELFRTKVSLESEIHVPDITPHVVAVDNSFSNPIEEVGGYIKHESDTAAMDAEISLSNIAEQRTDNTISRNNYSEHKSENFSPTMDNFPLVVHDHEPDVIKLSQLLADSGLALDPSSAENQAQVLASDGTINSGNGGEFIERNSDSETQPTEASHLQPSVQSCSQSKVECDSIIFEPCKSNEVISLVDEISLPLVVSPEETFEKKTEHLSLEPLSEESRSFGNPDPPFEDAQGHTWIEQKSRGLDESTLIEEAGIRNETKLVCSVGASQHVEDDGVEEQSRFNKTNCSGNERKEEAENVIRQLREALSMKEAEMASLLSSQAAKNSEQDMAENVLLHVSKRLCNLVSQGSTVNEDDIFHIQHIRPFDVNNGGEERPDLINLDYFLQACNYWMDELQKDLEGKRQLETMRRQLEDALLLKDDDLKGLTEKVQELSQNCDELQKDSEQMEDLKSKVMQLEVLLAMKDSDMGRLSDKVSELSQNCDVMMKEVAKTVEERFNLEGDLKHFQKLHADQETKASQLEELLSQSCDELQRASGQMEDLKNKAMQLEELLAIKDSDIGTLSEKVSELSQNCDVAMDKVATAIEERVNLEGELKSFQTLYAGQETKASLLEDELKSFQGLCAEQETKASQLQDLLSVKDAELERLFNKIAELSQNYDLVMGEAAKSTEERLHLAGELDHFQRLSAEQEEGRVKMCMRVSALVNKLSSLLSASSTAVDSVHGDAIDTMENLVASLQEHYETMHRESKDLLLRVSDSDAVQQVEVNNLRALVASKESELLQLLEKVDLLTNELSKTREDGEKKVQEAEQKVIGVRERLSLAVTKGKGLVQQRDNLKQLLAEKTAEFETLASSFKQELHSKTVALNEAEIKAKLNSEAVERVEALESELSYIRNSANALRESFLQKDAVLQKIEELLEDANLPEELQLKDINEKVEWLLEAYTQKTSILEGQDHSETVTTREMNAFSVVEQASQMQEIDDLNRKCDDLLRKYRGMAEQSAMLEQSLLERNLLIQRWEEMLDAVDMPAMIRLKEPEDKIEWLGKTVCDAHISITQFQEEKESLQTTIEALNNALQKLQEENVVLSVELEAKNEELRTAILDLEDMTVKYTSISKATCERSDDIGIPSSQAGLRGLEESQLKQGVLQQPHFAIEDLEAFATNIRTLLSEIVQGDEVNDIFSGVPTSTALESSVKLLVEKIKVWSTESIEAKGKLGELSLAMSVAENERKKELEGLHEALSVKTLELNDVTKQFEGFVSKNALLEDEVDNLQRKVKVMSEELSSARDELSKSQLEASQLEDKLASTREKLSMAVKKGKSVVQQRDTLKQSLDERTTELSQVRKESEAEILAFTKANQSLKQHLQQMKMLEAELLSSKNYATSLEESVQESSRVIHKFAEALDKIGISGVPHSGDLVEKVQWISQLLSDLQRKAGISEQEAKKSKKATELLALELEEVQGRMDSLADELMHAEKNISLLIEEKKLAEASKAEAGLRLEHAMANINSLLFELSESREKLANLDQENSSLRDTLSAQMEEIRYKQTQAEEQLEDMTDLYNKMYHLKANQSTFLAMVADQVLKSLEDVTGTKSLLLRVAGELKDQGFISVLATPVFANTSISKWQPEKTIQEWKQSVTTSSLKFLCDEMETELQHFDDFFNSSAAASNQDSIAISQLLMEICEGLGPLSQKMQTLKRDADVVSSTESLILEKDEQIRVLEEVLKAVTERLRYSIEKMEASKEEAQGQVSHSGTSTSHLLDCGIPYTSSESLQALTFSLIERLSSTAKDLAFYHQQNYIQKEKQIENLRSQLSKAREAIDVMDHQQQVDKLKINELQKYLEEFGEREDILKRTNQELCSLNDVLSTRKQEEEGLVESLNSAETRIEELLAKVEELEKAKQELEASLGKASSRFHTTISNFSKFQSLSDKLIEEAENLHLLLEDRDAQILLLKEAAALKGTEVTSLQNLIHEKTNDLSQLYQKIGEIVNRNAGSSEPSSDSGLESQAGSGKELLEAIATSVQVGAEGLRMQLARKDALLQDVQLRHDELARKVSVLESSLLENQRLIEERGHPSVADHMMISVETDDKGNRGKHATPSVAVVTHGRGGRKVSASDHLALDVDMESSRLLADMDDEDKGHVFKPLTSSKLVPRSTRILVDRLDGLWVSGERLLRRRPGARLSVMLYWIILHVWLVAILL